MFALKKERKTPEHIIQQAKIEIQHIFNNVSGVNFIMMCSTDGFELTTLYKKDSFNRTKLAAVSSSIVAMISAFMHEIDLKGCQSITLDAENGKAILNAIPNKNYPMIMVALTSKDILLGQALFFIKKCTEDIVLSDSHYTN